MVHKLIRDSISHDTVEGLGQLLAAAKAGHIVGGIFGMQLKGQRYMVNSLGTLARDPTLARGVCSALDDELARMVQGMTDSATTI